MKSQTVDEFVNEFSRELPSTFGVDQSAALAECKPILLQGIQDNFSNKKSSSGQAWPARKDPGPQHPLLNLTGALMLAATGGGEGTSSVGREDATSIELGVSKGASGTSLAGINRHQFGGGGILARPYMGISDSTADACADVIADFALKELE